MTIQKNILHYYVDLLRMKDGEERTPKQSESCVTALHNIISTMRLSRHDKVCGEDFSRLDFGNIRLDDLIFSVNGNNPSNFDNCQMNQLNFRSGHFHWVNCVRFSSDAKMVITGSTDETLIIWNAVSGLIINRFDLNSSVIKARILSDNTHAAALCSNDMITILDIKTGSVIKQLHCKDIPFLKSEIGFEWLTSKLLEEITICTDDCYNSTLWMKTDSKLITSSYRQLFEKNKNNSVILNSDAVVRSYIIRQGIEDIADITPSLWDFKTEKNLCIYSGHQAPVMDMDLSFDEKQFVSCSKDHSAIVWNIDKNKLYKVLYGNLHNVLSLAVSYDGNYCISGSCDKEVILIRITDGKKLFKLCSQKSGTSCVAFTPNNRYIIIGSWDGLVYIYDMLSQSLVRSFESDSAIIALAANNCHIVSCNFNGVVQISNIKTGQLIKEFYIGSYRKDVNSVIKTIDISSNCDLIAVVCEFKGYSKSMVTVFKIFENGELRLINKSEVDSQITTISISPNEDCYLIGTNNSEAFLVYMNDDDTELMEFQGLRGRILKVKFISENLIVIISQEAAIIINTENGNFNSFGFGNIGKIFSADISADGKRIAAAHNDHVYIINPYSGKIELDYYQTNLNILNCSFRGITADETTRKILYQYGSITAPDNENKS